MRTWGITNAVRLGKMTSSSADVVLDGVYVCIVRSRELYEAETIDEKTEIVGELTGDIGAHWYSHFQKTPITTPKKGTVQPEDAIEDTADKPGFEIVKF